MAIIPFTQKAIAPPQISTSSEKDALIADVFTRHGSPSDHATHAVCDVQAYGYMMEDLTTGKRFKIKRHELVQRFRPGKIL
tara:strand:- start:69 stop:311 length:243 start_codon:yes stop_codon:yes gene_type:complete